MAKLAKLLAGTMILVLLPAGGVADTIWLKSGKKIETGKTWKKGSDIQFELHGLMVNIARKDILRIETGSPAPAAAEPASTPSTGLSKAPRTPTRPAAGRAGKPLASHPAGFRGLFWGTPLSAMGGLRSMGASNVYGGITEYRRPYDPLVMGQAELEQIRYGFLNGQLATITIWTRGRANFNALAQEAANHYGSGKKVNRERRSYTLWADGSTNRMLVYYKSRGRGLLWMQAAELEPSSR
jgi:hypothetical protein